jgi:hypothetical protein
MYKKPIDTKNFNTKHDEMVETPCNDCGESTLKVMRIEIETHQRTFERTHYISVKLRCKCDNCGLKQTVQLVEMP